MGLGAPHLSPLPSEARPRPSFPPGPAQFPRPSPCSLLSQVTGLTTLCLPYSVSPLRAEAIAFTSAFLWPGT